MDNQTLINELYPTTGGKVGVVGSAAISIYVLASAIRSAKKGDYNKAIFKALLWNGITRNNSDGIRFKLDTLAFNDNKNRWKVA